MILSRWQNSKFFFKSEANKCGGADKISFPPAPSLKNSPRMFQVYVRNVIKLRKFDVDKFWGFPHEENKGNGGFLSTWSHFLKSTSFHQHTVENMLIDSASFKVAWVKPTTVINLIKSCSLTWSWTNSNIFYRAIVKESDFNLFKSKFQGDMDKCYPKWRRLLLNKNLTRSPFIICMSHKPHSFCWKYNERNHFWPRATLIGPKRSVIVVVGESWVKIVTKVTKNVTEVTKNVTPVHSGRFGSNFWPFECLEVEI